MHSGEVNIQRLPTVEGKTNHDWDNRIVHYLDRSCNRISLENVSLDDCNLVTDIFLWATLVRNDTIGSA